MRRGIAGVLVILDEAIMRIITFKPNVELHMALLQINQKKGGKLLRADILRSTRFGETSCARVIFSLYLYEIDDRSESSNMMCCRAPS